MPLSLRRAPTTAPKSSASTRLGGSFRIVQGPGLRARLFSMLEGSPRAVHLDCADITAMDGCGLAVLIEFMQACRRAAIRLRLENPSSAMLDAFAMYGLRAMFEAVCEEPAGLAAA